MSSEGALRTAIQSAPFMKNWRKSKARLEWPPNDRNAVHQFAPGLLFIELRASRALDFQGALWMRALDALWIFAEERVKPNCAREN